ncbi:MAG: DUF481 domain-containing protein [Steroidobacter sp.]
MRCYWLSLITLVPVVAMADDLIPPQDVWTGKGQAGYVASQGNTEARSFNAAFDAGMLSGAWKHSVHLGGLYGQSSDVVSAERWDTLWQSNYTFSPDEFVFGALRYSHDMFSGFEYQGSASAGYGYKFFNTPTTQLSTQLGVGYRTSRQELIVKDDASGAVLYRVPLDITNEAVFTTELDYSHALTGTTTISNKLLIESGSSNTSITDAFALTVKMSQKLALSAGVNFQDNTKPPAGLKKVDTTETVNLVYSF